MKKTSIVTAAAAVLLLLGLAWFAIPKAQRSAESSPNRSVPLAMAPETAEGAVEVAPGSATVEGEDAGRALGWPR